MKLLAGILLTLGIAYASEDTSLSKRSGKYSVTLRLPDTGLAAEDEMQIEFRIADTTEIDPVSGPRAVVRAKVETRIGMPEMPGMPKILEAAHPEGVPGDYGVHPTFPHGGSYRLSMDVAPPADEPFTVEFVLRVQDAGGGKRTSPRFRMDVAAEPRSPKAAEKTTLRLLVREREKPREIYSDFEIVHEKLMHLIIVSKDLDYFAHEHPAQLANGEFVVEHIFPRAGEYHLFADAAPRGAGARVMFAKLKVNGKSEPAPAARALSLQASAGGASVTLSPPESRLESSRTYIVPAIFRDAADGSPVADLENYLGTKAHLILLHEDAATFVHAHPDEREPPANGAVPFVVRFPKPGTYRAWLQFVRGGRLATAEFRIEADARVSR